MHVIINWLMNNKYVRWLGLVLLAVASALGYAELRAAQARRDAEGEAELNKATDYIKTRKRMDDADIVGDDPDAARRWLHERSKR